MDLIRKVENNVEFYTVLETGESGMSQSGLAILAGVSSQALIKLEATLVTSSPSECLQPFVGENLTLVTNNEQNLTVNGKSVGNLKIYKSSYCAAVIKHYASQPRQTPEAVYSALKFMEMGIDSWIQSITKWKKDQDAKSLHTNVYIQRIENMRDHKVSYDNWTIFRECAELLLLLEKDWRVPINDFDILDGSIGQIWGKYRKDKDWEEQVFSYTHQYRDQRGEKECNAFSYNELPYFRQWLDEIYTPDYLPAYLINKYGKHAVRLIYSENGLITDKILELTEVKRITKVEREKYSSFLAARSKLLPGN